MRALVVIGLLGSGFAACTLDTTPDLEGGDDQADADLPGDDSSDAPCPLSPGSAQAASLRNPETLECQDFGGECDPRCGACDQAPVPSWGVCGSECEALDEQSCARAEGCRVVKDAECLVGADCITDFLGCFPTDMNPDEQIDCWTADALECSRSSGCSAAHSSSGSGAERPFELCLVEGRSPGFCNLPVACDQAPPDCPNGTTPGVLGACYTGACIPEDLCQDF